MDRFPIIITIGAALLGFVAGEMLITDPATKDWVDQNAAWMHYAIPALGAAFVVVLGLFLAKRHHASSASAVEAAGESS
jgi:predicted tellurium resistance membrane protein TerC